MAFDKLRGGLQSAINTLKKAVVLDKKAVKAYTKEIQKVLLAADVSVELVFSMSKSIEDRGLLEKPPGSLSRKEHLIKVTYDELVKLVGTGAKLPVEDSQKMLLVGVQGSGKTTTAAKLAKHYKKQGLHSKLICADTFRPAAYEQLKQLSEEIQVPFYGDNKQKDTLKIIQDGVKALKSEGLIIIDSEGRHKLNDELMADINRVYEKVNPDKTILVLDGTIGQGAKEQAAAFQKSCKIDGVILSKLDGSAKGGGSMAACAQTGAPVVFLGVGEHVDDLETFDPKRFVGRLLGFGDLEGLLERATEADFDEEAAKRMMAGEFTLNDVYEQIEQMSKMGSMQKLVDMLPFGAKIPKDLLELQEEKVKGFRIIMDSMTEKEKEEPLSVKSGRVERIAKGSGRKPEEVRELLTYYKRMKKMVKTIPLPLHCHGESEYAPR